MNAQPRTLNPEPQTVNNWSREMGCDVVSVPDLMAEEGTLNPKP